MERVLSVLIVEDEQRTLERLVRICAGHPFVHKAAGFQKPTDAICFAQEHSIDLAILDIGLPEMDGVDLAIRLTAMQHIKIAFETGQKSFALEAFHLGAIGFLLKPYRDDEVERLIDKAAAYVGGQKIRYR